MQARAAGTAQTPTLIFKNASNSSTGTLITTTPVNVSKANSQVNNSYNQIVYYNYIKIILGGIIEHCCIAKQFIGKYKTTNYHSRCTECKVFFCRCPATCYECN